MAEPVRVFVSYSHKDPDYLCDDSLLGFLRGLEQEEQVEFWTDERIGTGTLWDHQIRERIQSSHIALVLVSQSFLDSSYCSQVEISGFLQRCRSAGMILFPVILSPCEWERHEWLASRQFLPGGHETIEEHYRDPGTRKRLFLRIRKELRSAIGQARQALAAAAPLDIKPRVQAEKRQLTAMRCDLVPTEADGSPLDPDDLPEILHELMPEFQQICSQITGRFDGHAAQCSGSGVLIYFGYPVAHEDDSRRAVRAGLAVLQTIETVSAQFEKELSVRVTVRVGIHTGWIVGAVAGSESNEVSTQGEVPTIAGHLQGLARPGSILVSEATQRLIDGFFECESLDTARLPGISKEIRLFEVTSDIGVETRFQAAVRKGLTPLVGRDEELALLLDRWKEAREARGQVVMLSAEAGVGKSRLLVEVKDRIGAQNLTLFECQCSPYHQNSALYPVISALQNCLGHGRNDSKEERLDRLEQALGGLFEEAREEIVPLVASLLSIPFEHRYKHPNLSPKEQKEKTLEIITAFLIESSLRKPVLLLIEDLHWCDPSTIEWLSLVIEQVPAVPILALFAFRPEFSPPSLWLHGSHVSQITLGRLSREQTAEMVARITGGKSLPNEVSEELFRKTEGFPLFVEDLTRAVLESDLLVEEGSCYRLAGPFQSLAIPDTLQEALLARLERLETARPVAQIGATIGREFVFEMLQAVASLDDQTLKQELNRLVSAGLLFRRGLLSRAKYIFKHALVQEALLQSLLKRQRRQYHANIASVIEQRFPELKETQPELVAHHYTEAGQNEQAIDYWLRAGERAAQNSANLEAMGHLRKGLELLKTLPEGPDRDRRELFLQTLHGSVLLALKGWASPELGACFSRARELCHTAEKTPRLFQVLRGMWTHHLVSAKLREALELAEDLREVAETEGSDDYRLEAQAALCDTLFWYGNPKGSRQHARLGLEIYNPARHHVDHSVLYGEDPAAMYYTYSALSLWLLGFPEQAKGFSREARKMIDVWTHEFSRCFLLCGIAWNHLQLREASEVETCSRRLKALAVEHHFEPWIAIGTVMLGWALAAQGRPDEGLPLMIQGREDWHATGAAVKASFDPFLIGGIHHREGRFEEGLRWVQTGLESAAGCDDRYFLPELHRLQGDILQDLGASGAEVEECYEKSLELSRQQAAKSLELRTVMSLARLWSRDGRKSDARKLLAETYGWFVEGLDTPDLVEARSLLSQLL